METIGWGILATGKIAHTFARDLALVPGARLAAVGSRRAESAQAFAREYGAPAAHGSYEELVSDPAVDVVYIATPHALHLDNARLAFEAGKHVLCEKPAAMDATEAAAMVEASRRTGRRLVEAFHDRYHPLTAHWLAVRDSGDLGEIQSLDAWFDVSIPYDQASIRHDPAVGGGALMDLGCYPVHWVRTFAGEEPDVVSASQLPNALGADQTTEAFLRFPSGISARVHCTMDPVPFSAKLVVRGTRGELVVDNPCLPHNGHSVTLTVDGVSRHTTVAGRETYDYQLDALTQAVLEGAPVPTEGADIVGNMTVIDAIYAAAAPGAES